VNLLLASLGFALVTAATSGLAAVGFSLQFAVSNVFNLAFGALLSLACYMAYAFSQRVGLEFWASVLVAIVFSGLFAAGMSRFLIGPFIRKGASPFVLMIVTFSLATVINYGLEAIFGVNSFTLRFGGTGVAVQAGLFQLTVAQLTVIAIAIVTTAALALLLHRTRLGIAIRAIVDNRPLAGASGVPTIRVTTFAWFLTGIVTGIAGLALAASASSVNPGLGDTYLLIVIPAAMLGGLGSIWGAVTGALVISVVDNVWSVYFGSQYQVLAGLLVLILVLLLRPGGIAGVVSRGMAATA
jgi:branched-subunit amino acid ABC-type transport system permease component